MARWPDTSPRTDADGWTERYGCYSKTFGGHFTISVSHSTDRAKPGYIVRVCDVTLTKYAESVEDGQRRGMEVLRGMLAQASEDVKKAEQTWGVQSMKPLRPRS